MSQKSSFRPNSAPSRRGPVTYGRNDLPDWAREQGSSPSFAKTVENQRGARPGSARARGAPAAGLPLSSIPKWISLDKKVLNFEAYFKEAVEESRVERYRVRRCVITYYLEDDSLKVSEPREENSGILQGNFLKRHKAAGENGQTINWRDIRVPGDLCLYNRTFRITKCDDFAREFFTRAGMNVGAEEPVPRDEAHRSQIVRPTSAAQDGEIPSANHGRQRNDMTNYYEALLGKSQDKKETVTKYLANDRKVLRFYCTWDERSPDGIVDKRPFIVQFFLADDTVEVLEVKQPNSGRDNFPKLLKRMKLPKHASHGGVTSGGEQADAGYYTASDFQIGGIISVFGRQLVLNDCDDATSRYYSENFGADLRPARAQAVRAGTGRPKSAVLVPAHNGFGKEEDARQNCISLHPKPPKGNVIRQLENKGKVLRFMGKLEHAVGFDVERVFTITYFLDADELSIFEPPVRNSGRTGGKFMEKCRVRKPNGSTYYNEYDFFLGARLQVYSRKFVLVDVDEYTLKYMEDRSEAFCFSDPAAVVDKLGDQELRALEAALRAADRSNAGRLPEVAFKAAVLQAVPSLNDHEVLTLARAARSPDGSITYAKILTGDFSAGLQRQADSRRSLQSDATGSSALPSAIKSLRKRLYKRGPSGLRGFERAMAHIARGSGKLDRADFDTVLTLCAVNLDREDAQTLFAGFDKGDGVVDCVELTRSLRPAMSPDMEAAVLEVFETLEDPTFKTGAVDVNDLLTRYQSNRHPKVVSGEMAEREARREVEDGLEGLQAVMARDLIDLYADIVAGYNLNSRGLLDLLAATWGLGARH